MFRIAARVRPLGIALLALIITAGSASAQTNYYWNAPAGGDGLWDLATQNWSTTTGGPVNYTWIGDGNEIANFGNTAGTVTLDTGITANSLVFSTTGYTITGNILTLAGTGGVIDTGAVNATINSSIAGSVGLTKNGTGTLTLGGANTYTGKTTIAAGTLTLGASNVLPAATTLQIGTFTGSAGTAVSDTNIGNFNLGAFSQTVGALYSFSRSSTASTITIASGQTLTVSSASGNGVLTAFGAYTGSATTGPGTHVTTFTGGGALVVNTPSAVFQVGQASLPTGFPTPSTLGCTTTVNMSALGSFTATVSDFRIGDFTSTTNGGFATLNLAPTSTITATNFYAASGRANASVNGPGVITVNLGTVANTINANTIVIGGNPSGAISNPRSQGVLKFLNANGTLTIRAQNGTGAANLFLGVQSNGSGTWARNNSINLDFHTVDLLLNAVQVGGFNGGTGTANANPVNGVFSFTQGTVSATSLLIGFRSGTSSLNNTGAPQGTVNVNGTGSLTVTASGTAIFIGSNNQSNSFATSSGTYTTLGTLAIAGGTLTLPNGGITLATNTGTFAGGSGTFATTGILNVFGGTVTVGGDIIKGTATSPGTATATLTLNNANAVLDLNGHRIGGTTAASAIDVLNLQAGTLKNVLQINNGAGLTKTGAGTLILDGANTYTGGTIISAGTVQIGAGGTSGSIVGNVTNNGILVFNRSDAVSFGGLISGTGAVNHDGSGATTLSGGNTYTGTTTINGGTLAAGAANTLPSGSAVAVNSGGTLNLNNFSQTIASLAGAGNVAFGNGSPIATLTTGGSNANTTFSGVISGTGILTKTGTGAMALTGNNTYDGNTNVNGGTLLVNGQTGTNSGTGTSTVFVNSGGTFGGTGRSDGLFQVNAGGKLRGGDENAVGTLTLNGLLSMDDGGILAVRVTDASTPSGTPGGSTIGTIPNPTSNNFLRVTNGGLSATPANLNYVVDGTGTPFVQFQTYSYQIGLIEGQDLSTVNVTDPARFTAVGFSSASVQFALTGGAGGQVYITFTPVPEPATVLGLAAAALGIGGLIRRRVVRRA
jgi:fibronectin-binding autotransporter adhesin